MKRISVASPMAENSDAPFIRLTAIESRSVGVRVKSRFGDFHLEIPVGHDPGRALGEARKTIYQFFQSEMTEAADSPLKFE